jgi:hypothetical protein
LKIVKVCSACFPERCEELTKFFGDGLCPLCGTFAQLHGYRARGGATILSQCVQVEIGTLGERLRLID